jgi:hypothetical protein
MLRPLSASLNNGRSTLRPYNVLRVAFQALSAIGVESKRNYFSTT